MAIPDNYIDKITKDGDSRIISPAADKVRVSNENFQGTDLDEVLNEAAQAITSLQNALNTLIGSGNVQGAIDTFNEVKAFLDGIDTDDPTLANQLLALNNAISAVQTSLAAKANTADVYSKSEVDTKVADAGKVKSVSVSGTKHTPDTNGDVDLGNLRGQDGNSGVASADGVESVNNLNGGTTDTTSRVYVLGANQGKRLRDQMELVYQRVQTLYSLMSGLAFTDTKPAASAVLPALDWGNLKHAVTLSLNLTNAVVKHNGVAVNNGASILVEEGSTLTLIVEAASGYQLDSVTSSTTGATVTDLGNGTYSVEFVMGGSNVTLAISGTTSVAVVTVGITTSNVAGALGLSNTSVQQGGTFVGQVTYLNADYNDFEITSVKDTSNNDVPYAVNNGTITIEDVPSDITITAIAKHITKLWINKSIDLNGIPVDDAGYCYTDFIPLTSLDTDGTLTWTHNTPSVGTNYGLLVKRRNFVFYDSNKRMMYGSSKADQIWQGAFFTPNSVPSRTFTSESLKNYAGRAGGNLPMYFRASFRMSNGTIDNTCSVVQGNKDYLDVEFAVQQANETTHDMTLNLTNCTCTATDYQTKVLDGQPVELIFAATSGHSTSNIAFTVMMGGVDVTSDIATSNVTVNGVAYKKLVLENITGALVINASC